VSPQTILFDLDDTLIHCNKYFDIVLDRFGKIMMSWFSEYGVRETEVREMQLEIDLAGVHVHGLKAERFPQSLAETYEHFSKKCGRPIHSGEIEQLLELGNSVYVHSIEPYPDMEQTLDQLTSSGHELFLYTGGDPSIQMRKVRDGNLERYFKDVFIALHKTVDFMDSLLTSQHFDRHRTWMIGNSLRTDVMPALEAGIHAIHIPAMLEWKYNVVDITAKPKGAFYQLTALREVPNAIHLYSSKTAGL
jgi:putative hydrolase of the HAD superfamily